ncbi:MAG: hypothetical protein ACYCUF_06610 [Acidimicrobiales bacterium]|nr:hypothetical protein [Actinomycetota bacterium]MDA8183622.1 hypothetical protein [Actinomycetota bacterium]
MSAAKRAGVVIGVVAVVGGLVVADGFTLAAGRHDVAQQLKAQEEGRKIAAYEKMLRERAREAPGVGVKASHTAARP